MSLRIDWASSKKREMQVKPQETRSESPVAPTTALYISNIAYNATTQDLVDIFGGFPGYQEIGMGTSYPGIICHVRLTKPR
jgi:hypothetical protein